MWQQRYRIRNIAAREVQWSHWTYTCVAKLLLHCQNCFIWDVLGTLRWHKIITDASASEACPGFFTLRKNKQIVERTWNSISNQSYICSTWPRSLFVHDPGAKNTRARRRQHRSAFSIGATCRKMLRIGNRYRAARSNALFGRDSLTTRHSFPCLFRFAALTRTKCSLILRFFVFFLRDWFSRWLETHKDDEGLDDALLLLLDLSDPIVASTVLEMGVKRCITTIAPFGLEDNRLVSHWTLNVP